MNFNEAVPLLMRELGYTEIEECWYRDDEKLTLEQAGRYCKNLDKMAEICKKHSWSMALILLANVVEIHDGHDWKLISDAKGATIQEAAVIATAMALEAQYGE